MGSVMIKCCRDFSSGVVCGNKYDDGESVNIAVCEKCFEEAIKSVTPKN